MSIGNRCIIVETGRKGTVKYIGKVPEIDLGFWIGVQLDEAIGDSNGSVNGKVYFDAGHNCAVFVRPS